MNSLYLQRECVTRLQAGCSDEREERLRAFLGVSEKAGQLCRLARSETFCHRSEPAEKAKFLEGAGDLLFWLLVACQYSGTDLDEVSDFLLQKMTRPRPSSMAEGSK